MNSSIEVVAALIWDNDKFMICQRPAHKARALLWEFVGGKVEPGETKEAALVRECQEELAITPSVGDVFMDVVHAYPDITVHLTIFNATIAEGVPEKLEHNDIRWIAPSEIHNYTFCPADEEILKKIIEKKLYKCGPCDDINLFAIKEFVDKWLKIFTEVPPNADFIFEEEMGDDCTALGFKMDCGHSFDQAYSKGEPLNTHRALREVINDVDDVYLLGSAIFSNWRCLSHWFYSSGFTAENRAWFLLAFNRLKELVS